MHFKWLCLCESVSVIPCNAYQTGQKDNPLSIPCFNLRLCLRPYHLIFPHDHPPARVPISQPRVNKNHMSHLDVLCFFIRCRPPPWRTMGKIDLRERWKAVDCTAWLKPEMKQGHRRRGKSSRIAKTLAQSTSTPGAAAADGIAQTGVPREQSKGGLRITVIAHKVSPRLFLTVMCSGSMRHC